MLTEQDHYTCVQSTVESRKAGSEVNVAIVPAPFSTPDVSHSGLFEFAANAPATLAERHPHLTVMAISAAVLLASVAVESECLRGSGYFW